ncbi:ligase-associated DNA damage response endonuclease PdeM [Geminicoccus roseus]|uniref:ligase-associated DNA damage response endonuclease PdeM n=1 Tax=Geminicoccus roseus TaxID=404900 RepID=UPI0004079763|nr:ligase-associated DNA damage response endonuclease PdeM [Geminicoccus roseus]
MLRPAEIELNGQRLLLDPAGVLFWPAERMLVVADLHLEKGAAFARRGVMLPPHDTLATLERLERVLARLDPLVVVSLGDGFHDRHGAAHLPAVLAARIRAMTAGRHWLWVTGNHDPEPPQGLGGVGIAEIRQAGLLFQHEPDASDIMQVAGHLHPCAKVRLGVRTARLGCFVTDGTRLVLPAFGAFTGGLNILDQTFATMLSSSFQAYVLGEASCRPVPRHLLVADIRTRRQRVGG